MSYFPGEAAAALVRSRTEAQPKIGLVLGSGLGDFAETVENAVSFSYGELPGFPHVAVGSHKGQLVVGSIAGVDVAVMAGRGHYYEKGDPTVMKEPIATFKALGCTAVILTNAAGGLSKETQPGNLMLIDDHINFAGTNPLFGIPTDDRFVGMSRAYDADLKALFMDAAKAEGVPLAAGVYMWFNGPSFETPAEIRAARILGADAVGMSTVPEVILARYFGLKVAAVSTVTNWAAGMADEELSHEDVQHIAPLGAEKLKRILPRVIKAYGAA